MKHPQFSHKKSLGQNFLINPEVPRRSLAAGELCESDVVLEIGPGQGALTRLLLDSPCQFIHAIEIDRRLEPWLTELENSSNGRLRIVWGDVLAQELNALEPLPNKVLANIPYNITTDLIWKLLIELAPRSLELLVLLVQKEAAERLRAQPCTRQRYPLGVTIEQMGTLKTVMKVSPGSFSPPPKVWSEVISLAIEQKRTLACAQQWRALLAASFSQRRKKLSTNLLSLGYDRADLEQLFTEIGISSQIRAEELTAAQWHDLYSRLFPAGQPENQ